MIVVLSPNPYRDRGLKAAQTAQKILRQSGVETLLCLPFALEEGNRADLPEGLEFTPLREVRR